MPVPPPENEPSATPVASPPPPVHHDGAGTNGADADGAPHESAPQPHNAAESLFVEGMARGMIAGDKMRPYGRTLTVVGILFVILLLIGFVPRWRQSRRLNAESRTEASTLPSVTFAKAEQTPRLFALVLPGNIEAIQETQLNARTSGYLQRYFVDIGDRVQPGQLLAQIDTPEVDQDQQQAAAELARAQAQVAQAQAQVAQQSAALETARANAARAVADLSRTEQTTGQQRAQVREARANSDLARVTWRRWASLVEGGAISQQEADEKHAAYNSSLAQVSALEAALRAGNSDVAAYASALKAAQADVVAAGQNVGAYRAALKAAQAGVTAAQSNLQRYGVLAGFREIRAPYAGVITSRSVDEGALVSVGNTQTTSSGSSDTQTASSGTSRGANASGGLFTLARLDALRIYIDVPQTNASDIHVGDIANVTVRERPKQKFIARVSRVSSALDQTTRTMRTEISLPNVDGVLLPGMFAQVRLDVARQNRAILVPSGALITDARGTRVAVVQNDKIAFRRVEVGRDFGESLEITSGLLPNDKVVTNPTDDLREGGRVHATLARVASGQGGGGGSGGQGGQGGRAGGGRQQTGGQGGSSSGGQGNTQSGSGGQSGGGGQGGGQSQQSPNAAAMRQESTQGGESTEDRAQPGGAARQAAQRAQGGGQGASQGGQGQGGQNNQGSQGR